MSFQAGTSSTGSTGRKEVPTNAPSKGSAAPILVAVSTSTAMSTITTSVTPVASIAVLSANTTFAATAIDPITGQFSSTSAALSTSTEQSTLPTSILPTSTSSTQTLVTTSTSTSTSTSSLMPTVSTSDTPIPVVQAVSITDPTTSPTSTFTTSSSTSSSEIIVATTSIKTPLELTSQNVQPTQAPASTTTLHSPTLAIGSSPVQSSPVAAVNTYTVPQINVGPMMGGVVGGVAFVGILLFLWWRYYKKKRSRSTVFSPTTGHFHRRNLSEKYEIDGESLGPTPRGARWKAQVRGQLSRIQRDFRDVFTSVRINFGGNVDAPGVNLDRGNSQFLETVPQHSRSNSAASEVYNHAHTNKERFSNWGDRVTAAMTLNWLPRKNATESNDPFADTQRMTDKVADFDQKGSKFSRFSPSRDRKPGQATETPRRSLSLDTLRDVGNPGFDLSEPYNSFANLSSTAQPTIPDISKPESTLVLNPFADPEDPTSPFTSNRKTSNLVANVQRSRGLSQPTLHGVAPIMQYSLTPIRRPISGPRYTATYRTSEDNNRDTFLSTISASDRKVKGRSDPFDLERAELQHPANAVPIQVPPEPTVSPFSTKGISLGMMEPRIENMPVYRPRVMSEASSKYSSGLSAVLYDLGDQVPGIEPLSWNKPLPQSGNGSSNVTSQNGGNVGMAL